MNKYKTKIIKFIKDDYLYLIFLISFAGVFGSLFFQFFVNLDPCSLCIAQRYFLYPLLPIVTTLILLKKKIHSLLFLFFSVPGFLIASYHVYIQAAGVPNTSFIPCNALAPCEVIDIKLFGFLTIPMLSAAAFLFITVLVIASWYMTRRK